MDAIDMVRGFALFGVLLVNMYNFGAAWPIWTGEADQVAFGLKRFFFETKSWRLFSFLFGLGFSLQLLSAQRRGQPFVLRYLRRLGALFAFGAAHALLYDGDILMLYAELGLLLLLFVRVPPRVLLALACGLLALYPVGNLLRGAGDRAAGAAEPGRRESGAEWYERRRAELEAHPYAVGTVLEVMAYNSAAIPRNPIDDPVGPESNVAFFAMFLLGLYVGRRGIAGDLEGHRILLRRVRIGGLAVGLTGSVLERVLALRFGYDVFGPHLSQAAIQLAGDVAFAFGSTALSLGYAAAIVLASRSERMRRWVAPLAPVGRMALTVYLTQSLIFTTLFYGYGFGYAGTGAGPVTVTVWAALIFAAQIVACRWWVRRYRFGPAEWAWRALTYLRFPPMRLSGT